MSVGENTAVSCSWEKRWKFGNRGGLGRGPRSVRANTEVKVLDFTSSSFPMERHQHRRTHWLRRLRTPSAPTRKLFERRQSAISHLDLSDPIMKTRTCSDYPGRVFLRMLMSLLNSGNSVLFIQWLTLGDGDNNERPYLFETMLSSAAHEHQDGRKVMTSPSYWKSSLAASELSKCQIHLLQQFMHYHGIHGLLCCISLFSTYPEHML